MDEDLSVKAPVTRLRRRLSVEAEDSGSVPTTPGTPTKKRGTRLAAKPQLELINELVTEDVPKRTTRKAAAKEAVEAEEAAPASVTPSRRSTRIRSNTSLLTETTVNTESPRAKRALRRNSQLGSDTESTLTPARQTRRTRKDSTTSVDNQANINDSVVNITSTIEAVPIIEDSKADNNASPATRKSPRLNKRGGKIDSDKDPKNNEENETHIKQKTHDTSQDSVSPNKTKQHEEKTENSPIKINGNDMHGENKLSLSSVMLIDKVAAVNKQFSQLNKSTPAIENIANELKDRKRTKSWSTISSPTSNIAFNSDNDSGKVKIKQKTLNSSIGSGDGFLTNDGNKSALNTKDLLDNLKSPNRSINKSKSQISVENKENLAIANAQLEVESEMNKSDTVKLFEKSPSDDMKPLVFMEDSNSCSDMLTIDIQGEGDQVLSTFPRLNPSNASPMKGNLSVEPMDIDETIPTNVTINDFSDKSNSTEESEIPKNDRKSVFDERSMLKNESINNSKRKSSVSVQSEAGNSKRLSIGDEKNNNESSQLNKSSKDSVISHEKSSNSINENFDKTHKDMSNRSASLSRQLDEKDGNESIKSLDKSNRKSSVSNNDAEKLNQSSNKSKRKSSISQTITDNNQNAIENGNNDSKVSNKSKRNSSISQIDAQNLEKTTNENKSTLVISQLKDASSNKLMSPNVTNTNLSMNGPATKNKEIDKKNHSLAYLTSTPIQQKPLQKLAMQINTSIISPTVEREETPKKKKSKVPSDSDSSDDESNEKINDYKDNGSHIASGVNVSKAPASSDSSDDESEMESKSMKIKKTTKKSPMKKSSTESSDSSDEELDTKNKSKSKIKKAKLEKKPINKNAHQFSNSDASDESFEGINKDNPKNKFINDEASDAGDNYESCDSQNDEERRYEAENEIVEKGETLDSEEDLSNDSDYEKDSFLVSSDAEDDEMLSGTGDDLSMSDNELTMSKKSKQKFNERKLKQQRNASKEMYNARHKINESANSSKSEKSKSKKTKRQRLDSSLLKSDNENTDTSKKNRLRIDSSQDITQGTTKSEADDSVVFKKKKSKRLSESVCEDMNEKEITLCNQSIAGKNDPLAVAIKKESKTPQKQFNMSTVAINDNIEEVQVDTNASMIPGNQEIDPLQATMVQQEDSSSDDTEIIQNYDSILNNLNKQTKKIKAIDTSLNLNKKDKDSKEPVIDQLNLTVNQGKKSKKNKINEVQVESAPKVKEIQIISKEDEDTSDSIDMKLLFPEDSNDSVIQVSQFKPENLEPAEEFIPLKRTDAQTNIPGNMDISVSLYESELNVSKKKNKKHNKSSHEESEPLDTVEETDNEFQLIIDTMGTHEEIDTSTQTSTKKKNKKMYLNNEAFASESTVDCTDGVEVTTILSSEKKKKNKNKSIDTSANNVEDLSASQSEKKKSRKKSENADTTIVEDTFNISVKSEKKKNASLIEPTVEEINISFKRDKKKKNNNSLIESVEEVISVKSDKKNKKNISLIELPVNEMNISMSDKKKKHRNTSLNIELPVEEDLNIKSKNTSTIDIYTLAQNAEEIAAKTVKSDKKKMKKNKNLDVSQIVVDNAGHDSDEAPMEMSYRSEKKTDASVSDAVPDDALTTSSEKKKHKKNKKKKNKNLSQSPTVDKDENETTNNEDGSGSKKKRKRKRSNNPTETEDATKSIPIVTSNEEKKRKILDDDCVAAYKDSNHIDQNNGDGSTKKSKKNKNPKNELVEQDEVTKPTKKRKRRDDDNEEITSKVSKQDYFDCVSVAKLPESLLNQLVERPKRKNSKKKEANTISTLPFVVEDVRRKNKPSQYLEQSVYINDSPSKEKKSSKQKRPKVKVLPFIPTALTSDSGYTSKFNINVLPKDTQFVAQASSVQNFKESYLGNNRVKKMGSLERCKFQRSHKISKF